MRPCVTCGQPAREKKTRCNACLYRERIARAPKQRPCTKCGKRNATGTRTRCQPCSYPSRDAYLAMKRRERERKAEAEGRVLGLPAGQRGRPSDVREAAERERILRSLGWSMELLANRKKREREAKRLGVALSSLSYTKRYISNPEFRERERIRARDRKLRRASGIEAASDGSLTTTALVALFASAKCCQFCRKRMKSQDKSLDHIVPLSKGGAHSVLNVMVCCKRCNAKKHARPVALMLQDGQQLPLVAA